MLVSGGVVMRVETLEYVLAVARCGSISRAAEEVFVSEQGLSKALKNLEAELDVAIFERSGRGVRLTRAGEAVVRHAESISASKAALLDDLDRMALDSNGSARSGELEIRAMPYVCNTLFNTLEPLMEASGLSECVVREVDLGEVLDAVRAQRLDSFALVALLDEERTLVDCRGGGRRVRFEPMFKTDIVAMGASSLLREGGETITVEELSRYPIAYYNEQVLNLVVDRLFASCPDCSPRIAQHSSNTAQIGKMVASGHAVTFGDTFSRYASSVTDVEGEAPAFARVIPTQTVSVGFLLDGESPLLAAQLDYVRRFKAMLESRFGNYLRSFGAR